MDDKQMMVEEYGIAVYELLFQNASAQSLDGFMIQFNKNSFGFSPASQVIPLSPLAPGSTQTTLLPVTQSSNMLASGAATSLLQVCIWTSICSLASSQIVVIK